METKSIRVSLFNHERLADIGHKNDSFNDIISKLLDEYEEYQLKTKIMANSETPYYGVVVCVASEEDIIDRAMLAKVGQEILNVNLIQIDKMNSYMLK